MRNIYWDPSFRPQVAIYTPYIRCADVYRWVKAVTIILRKTKDIDIGAAMYPLMQVLDIIHLDLNLAFGGTDQRKIHALLRDVITQESARELGIKYRPIVCIHLPMIAGLKAGEKMSSSKPETHIAVHDPPETIKSKMRRAYCPPNNTNPDENPVFSIEQRTKSKMRGNSE